MVLQRIHGRRTTDLNSLRQDGWRIGRLCPLEPLLSRPWHSETTQQKCFVPLSEVRQYSCPAKRRIETCWFLLEQYAQYREKSRKFAKRYSFVGQSRTYWRKLILERGWYLGIRLSCVWITKGRSSVQSSWISRSQCGSRCYHQWACTSNPIKVARLHWRLRLEMPAEECLRALDYRATAQTLHLRQHKRLQAGLDWPIP